MKIESDTIPAITLEHWQIKQVENSPFIGMYVLFPPGKEEEVRAATYFLFTPIGMTIGGNLAPEGGIWSKRGITLTNFLTTREPEDIKNMFRFQRTYLPEKAEVWLKEQNNQSVSPHDEHDFMLFYQEYGYFSPEGSDFVEYEPDQFFGARPVEVERLLLLQEKFIHWYEQHNGKI